MQVNTSFNSTPSTVGSSTEKEKALRSSESGTTSEKINKVVTTQVQNPSATNGTQTPMQPPWWAQVAPLFPNFAGWYRNVKSSFQTLGGLLNQGARPEFFHKHVMNYWKQLQEKGVLLPMALQTEIDSLLEKIKENKLSRAYQSVPEEMDARLREHFKDKENSYIEGLILQDINFHMVILLSSKLVDIAPKLVQSFRVYDRVLNEKTYKDLCEFLTFFVKNYQQENKQEMLPEKKMYLFQFVLGNAKAVLSYQNSQKVNVDPIVKPLPSPQEASTGKEEQTKSSSPETPSEPIKKEVTELDQNPSEVSLPKPSLETAKEQQTQSSQPETPSEPINKEVAELDQNPTLLNVSRPSLQTSKFTGLGNKFYEMQHWVVNHMNTLLEAPEQPLSIRAQNNPIFLNFSVWHRGVKNSFRTLKSELDRGSLPEYFHDRVMNYWKQLKENGVLLPMALQTGIDKLSIKVKKMQLNEDYQKIPKEIESSLRTYCKEYSYITQLIMQDIDYHMIFFLAANSHNSGRRIMLSFNVYNDVLDEETFKRLQKHLSSFIEKYQREEDQFLLFSDIKLKDYQQFLGETRSILHDEENVNFDTLVKKEGVFKRSLQFCKSHPFMTLAVLSAVGGQAVYTWMQSNLVKSTLDIDK